MKRKSNWPIFLPNPDWSLGEWCAWFAIVMAIGVVMVGIEVILT